jgi:hypothetical protein
MKAKAIEWESKRLAGMEKNHQHLLKNREKACLRSDEISQIQLK